MEAQTSATAGGRYRRRLQAALALTSTFLVVEFIAGLWTGSLALLADASHMLTDVGGLTLALIAIRFAARGSTPQLTYAYVRLEVLAALANASVLLLLAVYIGYEAYQRFLAPPEIQSLPMLVVAAVGLVVNIISMRLLSAGVAESLNVKGAYFEVLADMLSSLGVLLAALVVQLTGWQRADAVIAAGIGLFILPRTWVLLRQAIHILLEGAPSNIDMGRLRSDLLSVPGVSEVHDLHVWSITSGMDALSAHLIVEQTALQPAVRKGVRKLLQDSFGISHTTLEIETQKERESERPL